MAKILGGGMFGQMSGKLGSLVFSRNRGGNYARSFVKPIDPKTIAQINARSKFGIASNNYHSMDPTLKVLWQNFALNSFNPKTGIQGVSSGINAFTALLNVVSNFKQFGLSNYGGLVGTNNAFAFNPVPPINNLQANFLTSANNAIPFTLLSGSDITVSTLGTSIRYNSSIILDIDIPTSPTLLGNLSSFSDAVGNDFGFTLFMSNPVDQPGMFIQNPYLIKLGDWAGLKTITTPATPPSTLDMTWRTDLTTSDYSALPYAGQYVQITLFQTSTTGMQNRIGSYFAKLIS